MNVSSLGHLAQASALAHVLRAAAVQLESALCWVMTVMGCSCSVLLAQEQQVGLFFGATLRLPPFRSSEVGGELSVMAVLCREVSVRALYLAP